MDAQISYLGQFGKFLLRNRLGSGGMAEVYLAEMVGPEGFGKLVALKRILPHLTDDEEFTASFISEARLGGSLNHPNIVQTLELGREGEHYYLAMEYVEGVTLAQLLRFRREREALLPVSISLEIARQVCDALAYAHMATDPRGNALKMVHRDLKPDNVLLSLYGAAKIADFGVARASSNIRRTMNQGTIKGTIAYMSPEQAAATVALDHRSDLFSLGAILFEMLTLEPLYPNAVGFPGLAMVQEARVEERLSLLRPFPPGVSNLLTRLLSADRERRHGSALEVKRELAAVSASVPTSLMDPGEIIREAYEHFKALKAQRTWSESLSGGTSSPFGGMLTMDRQAVTMQSMQDMHAPAETTPQLTSSPSLPPPPAGSSPRGPSSLEAPRPTTGPGVDARSVSQGSLSTGPTSEGRLSAPPPEPSESSRPASAKGAYERAETAVLAEGGSSPRLGQPVPSSPRISAPPADPPATVNQQVPRDISVLETARLPIPILPPRPAPVDTFVSLPRTAPKRLPVGLMVAVGLGLGVMGLILWKGPALLETEVTVSEGDGSSRGGGGNLSGGPGGQAGQPGDVPPVVVSPAQPSNPTVAAQTSPTPAAQPVVPPVPPAETPVSVAAQPAPTPVRVASTPAPVQVAPATTPRAEIKPTPTPRPRPAAQEAGFLTVNSMPWSYVFVDGRKLPDATPLDKVKLPAGKHALKFVTEDGRSKSLTVTIKPDQTTALPPVTF